MGPCSCSELVAFLHGLCAWSTGLLGRDYDPFQEYFADAESIFRDFGGRPHWGKKHTARARDIARAYLEPWIGRDPWPENQFVGATVAMIHHDDLRYMVELQLGNARRKR